MKLLIAGDDDVMCQRVRTVLARGGLDCPPTYMVPLEVVSDRAGRLNPALVVLILTKDHERSLISLRELRHSCDAYTIVIGPADNSRLILRTMQEGADEYLDEALIDGELAEAIVRFKGRSQDTSAEQDRSGRVISILSPSGGCGSSTLAVNVSAALARKHGTCGLVDLRHTAGDLAPLLDMRPTYSMANLAEHLERIDDEMIKQIFSQHPSGIHLLAAPGGFGVEHRISDRVVRRAIAMARRRFPYVVIDVDNSMSPEQVEAIWQSEVVVIVLRLDYISLRNTRRTMEQLKQHGLELDHVVLVVNRYGEQNQLTVSQAEEALGRKISHRIPNDPHRINTANNAGKPIVLQRPRATVSRRLASLAESVNGHHPTHVQQQASGQAKSAKSMWSFLG